MTTQPDNGNDMTKDDIIKLAREAEGTPYVNRHYPGVTSFGFNETTLEAFAKRVIANIDPKSFMSWQEGYEAGVLAEREECADAVRFADNGTEAAEIIRARTTS